MRDDRVLLLDIANEIRFLVKLVHDNGYEEFVNDPVVRRAAERAFEIIGEASNDVTKAFKDEHSEIEWREMKDMRNLIIHDYEDIKYSILWETIHKDFPELLKKLEPLIPPE